MNSDIRDQGFSTSSDCGFIGLRLLTHNGDSYLAAVHGCSNHAFSDFLKDVAAGQSYFDALIYSVNLLIRCYI